MLYLIQVDVLLVAVLVDYGFIPLISNISTVATTDQVNNMHIKNATTLLLVLLITGLFVPLLTQTVAAEPTIYTVTINLDGSIDPVDAPITTTDMVTYKITADFSGSVNILRGNILLDGQDHSINGPNTDAGVSVNSVSNVTVINTHILNKSCGINLYFSPSCNVTTNTIELASDIYDGISVCHADNSIISFNTISGPLYSVDILGASYVQILNNTLSHDSSSGTSVFIRMADNITPYNNTVSGNTISGGSIGLYQTYGTNNTITLNSIDSANYGLYFEGLNNNTISNNSITNIGRSGVYIQGGGNNTICDNYVNDVSGIGLYIGADNQRCYNNQILNNTICYTSSQAIYIGSSGAYSADSNIISRNNITKCRDAIEFVNSASNTVSFNNFLDNSYGVDIAGSDNLCHDNLIYANNIYATTASVYYEANAGSNIWSNDGRGNYYNDYTTKYPDAQEVGTTGVWDTAYQLAGNVEYTDDYPLVNPIGLYILNVTSSGCGEASLSDGLNYMLPNEEIQVTANPDTGKAFLNWALDGVNSTDNPITVIMNANHKLDAFFQLETRSVTVAVIGGGTVVDDGNNRVDGTTVDVERGARYALTAVPNTGYGFISWKVDGKGTSFSIDNPLILKTSINYLVTASFGTLQSLTVESSPHGTVYNWTGKDVTGTTLTTINGSTYVLYAEASEGYQFSYWLLDGQEYSMNSVLYLNIDDANHTIQAVFTSPPAYILPSDNSDWSMGMHDASNTATSNSTAPTTNQTLWTHSEDDWFGSTPVIVNGIVYATSYYCVYAINSTTNQQLWCYEIPSDAYFYGSSAVVNGIVYVCTDDGYVYALNATSSNPDGELLWSFQQSVHDCYYQGPTVSNGVVYVGSENGCIYAINATNGELVWNSEDTVGSSLDSFHSSLAVSNDVVYAVGYNGGVFALNASTGELFWQCGVEAYFTSSAVVANGEVYVCSEAGGIFAFNATTTGMDHDSRILWYRYVDDVEDGFSGSLAVANGIVYACTNNGYVYALNATTTSSNGELLWVYDTQGDEFSYGETPSVANGMVYVCSDNGVIYALNAATENPNGELVWSYGTSDYFVCASPAIANGVLYANTYYGTIYAFAANTKVTFTESGLPDGSSWSVTFDGYTQTSQAGSIVFVICPTGQFTYTVTVPEGCTATPAAGTLTVNREDITKNIALSSGTTYDLTVNEAVGGTTDPAHGVYTYNEGQTASVTATASSGYVFSHWLLDGTSCGTDTTIEVNMNANHAVTPVFNAVYTPPPVIISYQLTVNPATGGTTNLGTGDHVYNSGSVATVTATPSAGYTFSYWLLDGIASGSDSTINVYMNSAHTLTPVFTPIKTQLTIDSATGGSTSTDAATYIYDYGTEVTVTATAQTGYTFNYWQLDGQTNSTSTTITLTMTANHTLTPVFSPLSYQLTINPSTGGSTSPNSGSYTYVYGETAHVTATPSTGYNFDHWLLDGQSAGSSSSIDVQMTANHTLAAVFTPITYTLTVNSAVGGSTTPTAGSYTYNYGQAATVTAIAATDYRFVNWILDGQNATSGSSISIQMIANHVLTPVFAEIPVTLVATETTALNTTYPITITGGNMTAKQMTNMTITPYTSNSTTVVAFNVTGPSGTVGTGTLALPKEAIPYGTIPQVYIDGVLAENQTYTEDTNYFYVTFTTHFSTHAISIVFTSPSEPESTATPTPSPTATPTSAPSSTATPTPTPSPTVQPTTTPIPTSSSTPTSNPTTPTEAGFPSYLVLSLAIALALFVVFAMVYRRKKKSDA